MHRLVVALTAFLTMTAAGYVAGWFLLAGSSDRAASLVPDEATAYVNVYLQPSAGQQANLNELIARLPGFADAATLDEKIDQIVQNVLAETGLNYGADVKPWLGDQVSIAAWTDADDAAAQRTVAIVDVKDLDAMDAALRDVASTEGESFTEETYRDVTLHVGETTAWAVVEQMLVASDGPEAVRAVIDTSADGSGLASRADFRSTMARVPADHLAAAFIDLGGSAAGGSGTPAPAGLTTLAVALIADDDGLRLTGAAPLPGSAAGASAPPSGQPADRAATLADWMPAGTLAEVTIFDLDGMLTHLDELPLPDGDDQALGNAAAVLGIVGPVLFDGEAAVAVSGIGPDGPTVHVLLRPTDIEAAEQTLAFAVAAGGSQRTETTEAGDVTVIELPDMQLELAYLVTDGVVVLGLAADDVAAAVTAHEAGETLAGDDAYEAAFAPIGGRTGNEAYVDLAALLDAAGMTETLPDDARAILAQLGTFSATARASGDQIEFDAVLTVEDGSAD